jgi:methionyl aminopeptidase
MSIEAPEDIEALKRIGAIVAEARNTMGRQVRAAISTAELDEIGRDVLIKHGARSAPRLAYGFPGWTCISVNDALAHGVPSKELVLRDGDLVNIDVSAELGGYWADTGATFAVGTVPPRTEALLAATRQALQDALAQARAGRPLREIGRVVEARAKKHGFKVIENIGGHGVGRSIHEAHSVSNTFERKDRTILREGMVIAIEPFLAFNARFVVEDSDGWTLRTPDKTLGAQFEHSIIITRGEPIVLTAAA